MIVYRNRFGQLAPEAIVAPAAPAQFTLGQYFLTAVAAGVTVWLITKWLGR